MYPLRKCRHLPKKECLYYHIGQCLGPCIREVSEEEYAKMRSDIQKFLRGDVKETIEELKRQMQEASEKLQFERAQEIHEMILSIQHIIDRQQIDFSDHLDRDVFGYYVDKRIYLHPGLLHARRKAAGNARLSVTPLYEEEMDAFISFIVQYYEHKPAAQ